MKKTILKYEVTGEHRPPKFLEYYRNGSEIFMSGSNTGGGSCSYDIVKFVGEETVEWKPKSCQNYFAVMINSIGIMVNIFTWTDDKTDEGFYKNSNCFQTRAEAERKAEAIKRVLKEE